MCVLCLCRIAEVYPRPEKEKWHGLKRGRPRATVPFLSPLYAPPSLSDPAYLSWQLAPLSWHSAALASKGEIDISLFFSFADKRLIYSVQSIQTVNFAAGMKKSIYLTGNQQKSLKNSIHLHSSVFTF